MKPNTITMAPTYFLTGENKMNYMKTQMKSDLWDIFYKAQADGVGREVTNAIIDIMILMDKEAEKEEETKC